MNQKLSVITILLGLIGVGAASPMFLVEDQGDVTVQINDMNLTKLNELTLTITSPAYVIISASEIYVASPDYPGLSADGVTVLVINGDTLNTWDHPTYMTWLDKGTYKIESFGMGLGLMSSAVQSLPPPAVYAPLLQVMVFLEDSTGLVSEPPQSNNPIPNPRSIVATGNVVHVDGCTEIYDLSGRKVDCKVTNGDIELKLLPAGTYFAHGSSGSTTKIVKSY